MTLIKRLGLLLSVLFALSLPGRASTLLYYWDFNPALPGGLVPTYGHAGAATLVASVGISGLSQDAGTDMNLVPPSEEGNSLAFVNAVSAFTIEHIDFTHLDFSLQTNVQLTVAVRTTAFFEFDEHFTYRYRASATDSWSEAVPWQFKPTSEWQLLTLEFGSHLDGAAAAQIRLASNALFAINERLELDNVQITAVPEPGTVGLAALSLLSLAALSRRRRA